MGEKKNPRYPHGRQQEGNHQNCPILPLFPARGGFFSPSRAGAQRSPFPAAARAAALRRAQKPDLFHGFIPQNTRSRLGEDFPGCQQSRTYL